MDIYSKFLTLLPMFLLMSSASAHIWEEIGTTSGCPDPIELEVADASHVDNEVAMKISVFNKALSQTYQCYGWNKPLENTRLWLHADPGCLSNFTSQEKDIPSNSGTDVLVTFASVCPDGKHQAGIRFASETLHLNREILVNLTVEDGIVTGLDHEIGPKFDLSFAAAADPELIEVEAGKTSEFSVFLRNAGDIFLHDVRISLIDFPFNYTIDKDSIPELKSGEIGSLKIEFFVPEGAESGKYVAVMDVTADEFPVSFTKDVFIFVVESGIVYYLSLIFVIALLCLLGYRIYRVAH